MPSTFDDLLEANRAYAAENPILGFDGVAHAGVAVVTCMDSRIDPLRMIGGTDTSTGLLILAGVLGAGFVLAVGALAATEPLQRQVLGVQRRRND